MRKVVLLLIVFSCFSTAATYAQLNVNTNPSLAQMVSAIVGAGNTVTNVVMNCPGGAYATFSNGNSTNVGISAGALLTTGDASAVSGTGSSFASQDNFASGDGLLTGLAGATTYDACRIEFDIVPSCNTLQMQYVFGSEEYPEFVNLGYNDAFGFFISGPNPSSGNYNNYNIAVIPSTTTPVTIDNVNSGMNSQYYVDNTFGTTIAYDGFTTPLTASVNVVPCATYHMIFVIADGGDGIYDSGVFLTYQGLSCPTAAQVIAAGGSTVCAGQPTTLTASNSTTYTWSPATGLNTTTGATVIATPSVTTTYTVTGFLGCGSSTATVTVNVTPGPSITVTPPSATVCTGGSINLTANGGTTYTWAPDPTLNTTTGASVVATPTTTTTYIVTGDNGGCTNTASVTVSVGPITAQAGPDVSVCQNSSVQLSASGGTSYSWSPATGLSSTTIANPLASPLVTTTYVVTASVGTCTANDTIVVTVDQPPTVSAQSSAPSICAGSSVTLTGSGASTYSWSPATSLSASTGTSVTATPLTTTTYSVVATAANGCTGTATINVNVTPSPDPTITAAGPYCNTSPAATLNAATAGGTWSGTGITNASAGTFDPATAGAGTFNIVYTVTTNNCTSSDTLPVTVSTMPNAAITAAGPYCVNAAATNLNGATTGGTWSGTGITNNTTGTFNPATAGAGTFPVIYTVNNNGCIDDDTLSIVVNPLPNAAITAAGPFCANSPALNLSAATAGGTWSGTGITNTSAGTFDPATGAGNYTVNYSVTDNNGCTNTSSTSITVNANANASVVPAGPFCTSSPALNLTAAQTGGTWSGTGITNSSAGTFNPTTAGAGTYTITYIISGMCGDTGTVTILVAPPPPSPAAPSAAYCSGEPIAPLTATSTSGGTLTWYSDAGLTNVIGTGSPLSPMPVINSTTTYWVTETIGGCQGPATPVTVTINPTPVASFTPSPTTGMVPFVVTYSNNSLGANGYQWSFGDGHTSTLQDPTNEYTGPGTFTVTLVVTSAAGCTDTTSYTIIADAFSAMTVPNVFSPNGDGMNDLFMVTSTGIISFHGEIFDRWGLKVFTWDNADSGWNGITDKGNEASDGTYYYIITGSGLDGQTYDFHGFLTLLRKKK